MTNHDGNGPSFLSQLIGLVLVVALVVGVWALVTDSIPSSAPKATLSQRETNVDVNTPGVSTAPAPAERAATDLNSSSTTTPARTNQGSGTTPGGATQRTETQVEQTSTTRPAGT